VEEESLTLGRSLHRRLGAIGWVGSLTGMGAVPIGRSSPRTLHACCLTPPTTVCSAAYRFACKPPSPQVFCFFRPVEEQVIKYQLGSYQSLSLIPHLPRFNVVALFEF
jgi:hypothetical protein